MDNDYQNRGIKSIPQKCFKKEQGKSARAKKNES